MREFRDLRGATTKRYVMKMNRSHGSRRRTTVCGSTRLCNVPPRRSDVQLTDDLCIHSHDQRLAIENHQPPTSVCVCVCWMDARIYVTYSLFQCKSRSYIR